MKKLAIKNEEIKLVYTWILGILTPLFTLWGIEYVNNDTLMHLGILAVIYNLIIFYAAYALLYLITNRVRWSIVIGCIFFCIYGILNQFIQIFRYEPILPWDLKAISTAVNVSGEYTWVFTKAMKLYMGATVLWCVLALWATWKTTDRKIRLITDSAIGSVLLILVYIFVFTGHLSWQGLYPIRFDQKQGFYDKGTVLGFVSNLPCLIIDKPKGYSEDALAAIEEQYPVEESVSADQEDPNIIVIMNESFADVSVLGDIQLDADPLEFWNSLEENTIRGTLATSAFGGGTAKTEFEFLTGDTMAFLPDASVAYQTYVTRSIPSLATVLEARGYSATAMHPAKGTNWNRVNAYPFMGFQEFYDISKFDSLGLIRGRVSDTCNYAKLIDVFEEKETLGQPVFMFDVTIQNHGGYNHENYEKTVHLENFKKEYPEAEEYFSSLKASDDAFRELIAYFKGVKRPTVVVMFGDHQPNLGDDFYEELMGKKREDYTTEEVEKLYEVPFVIWANYDIEETTANCMSPNYLGGYLLKTIGYDLPAYWDFLQDVQKEYPTITTRSIMDTDGTYYEIDDVKDEGILKEYQYLQYNHLFDKESLQTFFK